MFLPVNQLLRTYAPLHRGIKLCTTTIVINTDRIRMCAHVDSFIIQLKTFIKARWWNTGLFTKPHNVRINTFPVDLGDVAERHPTVTRGRCVHADDVYSIYTYSFNSCCDMSYRIPVAR